MMCKNGSAFYKLDRFIVCLQRVVINKVKIHNKVEIHDKVQYFCISGIVPSENMTCYVV